MHQVNKLGEKLVTDWQDAGLFKSSVFKPILATIENPLVPWKLGSLRQEDRLTLELILQDIPGYNISGRGLPGL